MNFGGKNHIKGIPYPSPPREDSLPLSSSAASCLLYCAFSIWSCRFSRDSRGRPEVFRLVLPDKSCSKYSNEHFAHELLCAGFCSELPCLVSVQNLSGEHRRHIVLRVGSTLELPCSASKQKLCGEHFGHSSGPADFGHLGQRSELVFTEVGSTLLRLLEKESKILSAMSLSTCSLAR